MIFFWIQKAQLFLWWGYYTATTKPLSSRNSWTPFHPHCWEPNNTTRTHMYLNKNKTTKQQSTINVWSYLHIIVCIVTNICKEKRRCIYIYYTSSTAQGGGGSFKNRKPIGEVGCCESGMAKRSHWWIKRCLISLTLSLSLWLSTYLPIYFLCIYLSIYLSLSLSIYLSIHPSIYLSIYLFISLSLSFI